MTDGPDIQQVGGVIAGSLRRRLIPAALLIVAVVLVVLVAMIPGSTPSPPPREMRPVNVEVLRIHAIPKLRDTFDLTAIVEPDRVVSVAAEVNGRIERIADRSESAVDLTRNVSLSGEEGAGEIESGTASSPPVLDPSEPGAAVATKGILREGDTIVAGAPIVYLNTDLLLASYQRALAQFDFDGREYQRILRLYEHDASARNELDDARAKRDISKATLDEAAAQLARAVIVAPIDGILNSLPMEVGEYATPGDSVAQIVDIDRVKVVVDVPERDVHYLNVGDVAEVHAETPQILNVTGLITYVSEIADEQTRTTRVEITVPNPDRTLRSGQILRAHLTRRVIDDVIMIPLAAVIPLEHGKAVYVVDDDGNARRKEVELGLMKGRDVRILSGLDVGDRLIVVGHRYVGPGQPVTVVEER